MSATENKGLGREAGIQVACWETLVSEVCIVLQRECEFSMAEVI